MKKIVLPVFIFSLVIAAVQSSGQTDPRSAKARKAALAKGKQLYDKHSCSSCHGEKGVLQGDLRAAYKKYSDDELKQYIKNPRAKGNMTMPVYGEIIPEADYAPLIEYVKFLGEQALGKK